MALGYSWQDGRQDSWPRQQGRSVVESSPCDSQCQCHAALLVPKLARPATQDRRVVQRRAGSSSQPAERLLARSMPFIAQGKARREYPMRRASSTLSSFPSPLPQPHQHPARLPPSLPAGNHSELVFLRAIVCCPYPGPSSPASARSHASGARGKVSQQILAKSTSSAASRGPLTRLIRHLRQEIPSWPPASHEGHKPSCPSLVLFCHHRRLTPPSSSQDASRQRLRDV